MKLNWSENIDGRLTRFCGLEIIEKDLKYYLNGQTGE